MKDLSSLLKFLFLKDTAKDTTVVMVGTLINVLAGGLFFVITPRILGPQEYGIFSTVISTSVLLITIANFGIDTGILRFAKQGSENFEKILSLAFKTYIFLGMGVGIIGLVLSPAIALLIKSEHAVLYLRIAFLFSTFILLTNYFVASLQAKGEFAKASIVNILGNLSRLVVLLAAIWFLSINVLVLTLIFFITPLVSVIIGVLLSPPKKLETNGISANFFKYNLWIALALVISSVPYDNYILMNLIGPKETGIYQAPFKVLTFAYIFGGNFTRVLAQRFSSFETNKKAISFSLKISPFVLIFSGILLLTIPFSKFITNLLFTEAFINSADVYKILTIGFSFFFLSTVPSSVILYFLGKSQISFYITVLKYVLFITLLLFLIPKYEAVGAALAFTLSEFVSLFIMTAYSFWKTRD